MLSRPLRVAVAVPLLLFLMLVPAARGQEHRPSLAVPNGIFAAAAAIDWTSTYYALSNGCKEDNVLINGLQRHPPLLISAGAGIDLAGAWAWNYYLGRRHPRLASVGLYTAAAFRLYLAIRNVSAAARQRDFNQARGYTGLQ